MTGTMQLQKLFYDSWIIKYFLGTPFCIAPCKLVTHPETQEMGGRLAICCVML